jgi:rhodanese-related sulfurtransferase
MLGFLSRLLRRPAAASRAEWIEIPELRRRLADNPGILLIDVRQPEEFGAPPGHLPGAINMPLGELPEHVNHIANRGRPVVLVCKTDRRSARAAETLLSAGIRDVQVLRGGTDGWHEQGLPLE